MVPSFHSSSSMPTRKLSFATLVIILLCVTTCKSDSLIQNCNVTSFCGHIKNITFPFRFKTDPDNCGDRSYELDCINNQPILYINSRTYYVLSLNYANNIIQIIDPGISEKQCPSLIYGDITTSDIFQTGELSSSWGLYSSPCLNTPVMFVSCSNAVESSLYIDSASCNTKNTPSNTSSSSLKRYSYVLLGIRVTPADIDNSCKINKVAWFSSEFPIIDNTSFVSILDTMTNGFSIKWRYPFVYRPTRYSTIHQMLLGLQTFWYDESPRVLKLTEWSILIRFLCGIPFLLILLVYKYKKHHQSVYDKIEDFLQAQNNLVPIRYGYWDVIYMTTNFKDKLGEGGYGSVYKGKLKSGLFVAVKMMKKSKASGQEFINEVATIGTIHHVNVVQLIGFCVEGSKRALIYEFMPNGSLEKYLFSQEEGTVSLTYEKMFEISLGVARGLDYLHRGCEMQILHFDIKPHNILLDDNFNPKVSDFGLAKLYSTENSIVSLTAARGTMGYMAPELFYKNIGGVSYKADVYSYGMLLMEMAGRRKNLNPFLENLSQIYFPSWVYDQFSEGKEIGTEETTGEERKMVKKMILVALWCIQMKPVDRPSMNKIVEMLEGDDEILQMPPKPSLFPEESPVADHGVNTNDNDNEVPLMSGNSMGSTSLDQDES